MSSVSSVMNNFSNAVKDLGGSIGGTAGEVISLIGDIGLFATESVQGVMKSIEALDVAATAGAKSCSSYRISLGCTTDYIHRLASRGQT